MRDAEVMRTTVHRWILVVAGTVWLAALGAGFTYLKTYSATPGVAAAAPEEWPRWTRIPPPQGHAVLVMTMHPHCPCTRASVTELNNLMALLRGSNVKGYVLAVKPRDFPEAWIKTESYRSAERIPGVEVLVDEDGLEAGGFGAQTSGEVLLYDEHGRLQFAGGITPDRGHLGDSPGRQRILSLVKNGTADSHESLVFGCALGATSCPLPPKPVAGSLN
jgi:hypothetical protein